jgi:hypothetical protein
MWGLFGRRALWRLWNSTVVCCCSCRVLLVSSTQSPSHLHTQHVRMNLLCSQTCTVCCGHAVDLRTSTAASGSADDQPTNTWPCTCCCRWRSSPPRLLLKNGWRRPTRRCRWVTLQCRMKLTIVGQHRDRTAPAADRQVTYVYVLSGLFGCTALQTLDLNPCHRAVPIS